MSKRGNARDSIVKHLWDRDVRHRDGDVVVYLSSRIEAVLGPPGRLIWPSKSAYRSMHPDHEVIFNACLFAGMEHGDDEAVEVWFGDIDLTLDGERLERAAETLGCQLVLTPEQPFRFEGLAAGMCSYAASGVRVFTPR